MTMNSNIDTTHAVTINSLQKIIDYIEENITEPLTPTVIAGLSWNIYETDGLHLPVRSS